MSHELIEAMARAMEKSLVWDVEKDVYAAELTHEERCKVATAALNALRDTLKPWGYSVQEEAHPIISYITIEKPTEPAISITPLHALPEVNKHGA